MKIKNLIVNLYLSPWLVIELGLLILLFPINFLLLLIWRIEFKFPFVFYGVPLFVKTTGSRIKFGKRFETRNGSWANLVGINHRCCISTYAKEAQIIIGNDCGISGGAIVARQEIIIGNNVLIGANCLIVDNDFHPLIVQNRRYSRQNIKTRPVFIDDNVFIGTGSIILKGSKIGRNSVIGAGSIVSGIIPPNCIAAGNPAKVLKKIK